MAGLVYPYPGISESYKPIIPPFQHQLESLIAGHKREAYGYLLEMGLGKSRVAIDDFCLAYEEGIVEALLIVAPKSVYTNWTRFDEEEPGEIQKWAWGEVRDTSIVHAYRAGKSGADRDARFKIMDTTAPGARILAVNAEAISSTKEAYDFVATFMRRHKTFLVIDESTIIKDRTSNRTKRLTKLGKLAHVRRILTGSPTTGSPTDVWGQFEFLEHGLLEQSTFVAFQARYCLLKDMRIGGRIIKKEYGTQNLEELRDILKKHSIRFRKADCLDLEPKVYEPLLRVEMTDEQKSAYNEMKRTAMAVVRGEEVTTTIVMTQLMKLHQIACGHITTDEGRTLRLKSNRANAMLDVISRSGSQQAVIWCNYRADADIVTEALVNEYGENSVVRWTGAEGMDVREAGEKRFQQGEARFMVATQSAGARGRTWTAGTLVIYYSNSYDLESREQSEDRTHRIGQTGTVTYVDLVVPGTVEEKIIKALRSKKDVARAIQEDGASAWI